MVTGYGAETIEGLRTVDNLGLGPSRGERFEEALAHLTRQIRVETMLQRVHDDATATMATNLVRHDDTQADRLVPRPPAVTATLWATSSGFLTSIDQDDLLDAAERQGLDLTTHGENAYN